MIIFIPSIAIAGMVHTLSMRLHFEGAVQPNPATIKRVLPGGGSYYVFVLDDSDCNYRVKAVHGPFTCK